MYFLFEFGTHYKYVPGGGGRVHQWRHQEWWTRIAIITKKHSVDVTMLELGTQTTVLTIEQF